MGIVSDLISSFFYLFNHCHIGLCALLGFAVTFIKLYLDFQLDGGPGWWHPAIKLGGLMAQWHTCCLITSHT